jgi:uncharacterized protein with PhoU and TrkA domain
MALRRTTQAHTTEAQLLVLPVRADAMPSDATKRFAAQTEEAVMDQSLSAQSQSATRRLRNLIILSTACMWLAIIAAIRFFLF